MKLIYVASPYHGDIKGNLEKASKYSAWTKYDGIPICPHLYFSSFLDDNFLLDRSDGRRMGEALLAKCDEMHVFCDEVSEGIIAEIKLAKEKKIPIKFFDADGNLIEYDALLINKRIGPGLRKMIEEYHHPGSTTVMTCPYANECRGNEKPHGLWETIRRWKR